METESLPRDSGTCKNNNIMKRPLLFLSLLLGLCADMHKGSTARAERRMIRFIVGNLMG